MRFYKLAFLFLLLVLVLPTLSCKKYKKGVLEIKHTINSGSGPVPYYYAIIVDDDLYEPGKEFEYKKSSSNIYTWTGYYWPDESAKSLGYKYKCDTDEEVNYRSQDGCDGTEPGENGHWSSEGSGGNGSCPVGTWYSPACGNPKGVIMVFNTDKTGYYSKEDCQGVCTPFKLKYTYSLSGNTCTVTYLQQSEQDIMKCSGFEDSRPKPPSTNPVTMTLECNGNELLVDGTQTFTK